MRSTLLLALICVCVSLVLAKKQKKKSAYDECRYDTNKGAILPFFAKNKDQRARVAMFPCGILLAKLTCGGVKVAVTVRNKDDNANEFVVTTGRLSIDLEYELDSTKYQHTLKLDNDDIQKFKAKKNLKKLLEAALSGSPIPDGSSIVIDADKKADKFYVEVGELRVSFISDDTTVISCTKGQISEALSFPNTMCGSPFDDKKIAENLFHSDKHNAAVWELVQLAKQDEAKKWTQGLCPEAREAVKDSKCDKFPETMLVCHNYYDVFDKDYGRCMRESNFNPIKGYIACVMTKCHEGEENFKLDKEQCEVLEHIQHKCGNATASETAISLLQTGYCKGYRTN